MSTKSVCVLGAGVNGLSSAVCILEECPRVKVTLIAENISPDTTSDISAGFWYPYRLGNTHKDDIRRWSDATLAHLYNLYNSPLARETGCQLISGYNIDTEPIPNNDHKDQVFAYRNLTPKELGIFPSARYGTFQTGMQVDVTLYLNWLMARFKDKGGILERKRVSSLDEVIDEFDIVVNCTGLGSYSLLGDNKVSPVRGQVLKFYAPWIKHFFIDLRSKFDRETYILPGSRYVVVGGTCQEGDWNNEVDPADSEDIYQRAVKLVPSLKGAQLVSKRAGLRPARTEVRLEREVINKHGKITTVIHNYGHGGGGVTLHWGCAQDVLSLIKQTLNTSKL